MCISLNAFDGTADVDGSTVRLTDIEYAILERLLDADGEVVSDSELQIAGWGREMPRSSEVLRQRMCCLRKKIGRGRVHCSYGYGYRVEP